MISRGMFNGKRYDASQKRSKWDPHPPFQLRKNRAKPQTEKIQNKNLKGSYMEQNPTSNRLQDNKNNVCHESRDYSTSMKKSNTLQDLKQETESHINIQDKSSYITLDKSSHNSASSPGFQLTYEHLHSACFFPKSLSLTKNSSNSNCHIQDTKNINEEFATKTNTISSGSESERNSVSSSSNRVTNEEGTYNSASGMTSNIFLSPGNPGVNPYFSEGVAGLGCGQSISKADYFSRVPNNSAPNMGGYTNKRKSSCNSNYESSQMFKSLGAGSNHRKSLPVNKGSAMYKTTYNKFNGPSTTNKFLITNTQAQSENTEILSVNVKLSCNCTEVFKLKRFDNLYLTVKMFCESHSIAEHMIRPLCETISQALNRIFTVFNLPVEKSAEEYLKSLSKLWIKKKLKEKEEFISFHKSINKLKVNEGEDMLSFSSLTTVDYNDDDCHSCTYLDSSDDNLDENNKLNKTF